MASTVRFDDARLERRPGRARCGGGILAQAARPCLAGHRAAAIATTPPATITGRSIGAIARHDELRVRQFAVQRDCRVHLLLDASASMGLGTPVARFTLAARIASPGLRCVDQQAELTLLHVFRSARAADRPCDRSAARLLRELARLAPGRGGTNLRRAAERFARHRRGGPRHVVVISDLGEAEASCAGLDVLRLAGCSPRVVHIHDPREAGEVAPGDLELVDVESGDLWQVTITRAHLRRYGELLAEQRELPRRYCRKWRVPYVRAGLDLPEQRVLQEVIRTRSRFA